MRTHFALLFLLVSGCRPADDRPADRAAASADSSPAVAPSPGSQADSAAASPRDTLVMRMSGGAVDSAGAPPPLHVDDSVPAVADSGTVTIFPDHPERGGVIVAIARSNSATSSAPAPRCTWRGEVLPCHASADGTVRLLIPLSADRPAGTFQLTLAAAGVSVRRTIAVGDRDFGRELIFLDSVHYALVRRRDVIARDARAARQVLDDETPQQLWSGPWLNPAGRVRAQGYGVERAYYAASDSSRVVRVAAEAHATGAFGADTTMPKAGDTPSWRHAGIDLPLARGGAARAAAAGTVADAGEYVLTGRTVILDHGEGVHTAYFHLDTISVRRGDRVRRGERIGRVGSTGLATGPHLHYGVYVHGADVDPALWHSLPASALRASP